MKINVEIDLTTEEFQDLFVPSEKQQEFAQLLAQAYFRAATNTGAEIFNKTSEELRKLMGWKGS